MLRLLFVSLLAALPALSQVERPGPQVATFFSDVDDSDQPYGLYLPKNFNPAKKYPLVISLHGAGSNHRLNLRRVFGQGNRPGESDGEATRYFPPLKEAGYIVASPLARGTMGFQGIAERDVLDVLADVKKRFPIDEDRVYLTGLSMGGGGTLWLGLTRPDLWAAIAPVCPAPPAETEDLAENALNLPAHFFHGDADTTVPVEVSRRWVGKLKELGARVEYTEYPGIKHNSWDSAYQDGAIFDWFAKFRRERFPERVRFATRSYRHAAAYWVRFDGLTPGARASIDARFSGPNRIEAKTEGLDGFTLNLAGHPRFAAAKPVAVSVDGAELRCAAECSFQRVAGAWKPGRFVPSAGSKRPGADGPVAEAVAARHMYVYGTEGNPSPEELTRRRNEAAAAADWSPPRSRLQLNLRVLADKEVRDSDLTGASLVLFGTQATNLWIRKLAPRLPLELNAGAADYCLLFVTEVDGRLVLVNSGLPWWTGAEFAKRPGFRFIGAPIRLLLGFGDYLLFKGSLENVAAEGRFDARWRLPSAEAAKMKATGAVAVKE
ncbi:MAG: phospholipase [Acidobacteria bacterium]|nr:phospholipase [Acidobacteriota bacterium]